MCFVFLVFWLLFNGLFLNDKIITAMDEARSRGFRLRSISSTQYEDISCSKAEDPIGNSREDVQDEVLRTAEFLAMKRKASERSIPSTWPLLAIDDG